MNRRRVTPALLAASLASAPLLACDATGKSEASRVLAGVERYRRAENADKPARTSDLRTVSCTVADVCRARDACLASAEATSRALRLKAEVERDLAALEHGTLAADSAEARQLPKKLDQAEALLKEGLDGLAPCDEATRELKRRYRL